MSVEEFDFSEIQRVLEQTWLKGDLSFYQMVMQMMKGELPLSVNTVLNWLKTALFSDIKGQRDTMLLLLGLGVMAAVFYHISQAFTDKQTSEMSFFMIYLTFLSISMAAFHGACEVVEGALSTLSGFMTALVPAFSLSVAMSVGGTSAMGFYQVSLIVLSALNTVLVKIALPMIQMSVALSLVNNITKEEMISRLVGLFRSITGWILKGVISVIAGMNLLQGILLPAVDQVKTGAVLKAVSLIPGIGDSADAVTELVTNSGVLLKNCIGIAGCILLILIAGVPLLKTAVFTLLYRLLSAMLEPISDKRMTSAAEGIGEGGKLLIQLVVTAALLFLLSIVVMCMVAR